MSGPSAQTSPDVRSPATLSRFIGVNARFARSVNLREDIKNPERLTTYYFGRKSVQLFEGVLQALRPEVRDRAWFVVGPYGSGKSTFGLFLSRVLCQPHSDPWLRPTLSRLRTLAPAVHNRLDREVWDARRSFVPVIVQGHRGDLSQALLAALLYAAEGGTGVRTWADEKLVGLIGRSLAQARNGRRIDSKTVLECYRLALAQAKQRRRAGILLVVDEFGKFLEGAPFVPGGIDLIALQELAEFATRSTSAQLHMVLFLHQSFEQYAIGLPNHQRQEWAKIQGRFREIDFTEDADEVYDLVAAALEDRRRDDPDFANAVGRWAVAAASKAHEFPAFQIGAQRQFWKDLFTKAFPLHPLTLFALPRLSARVAQNERTVFTFLASDEPLALRGFLQATPWTPDCPRTVTLDYLYDYFLHAFRGDLGSGTVGRRWIEVASALDRLGDRPDLERRVIKVVGLLNILAAPTLVPASREMIGFSLDCPPDEAIDDALRYLIDRKILVFRRYSNEYRAWQGSDFEFDAAVDSLRQELRKSFDVGTYLQSELPPPTIVARRHSHRLGVLRFFRGRYVSLAKLRELDLDGWEGAETSTEDCDGNILYALPSTQGDILESEEIVKRLRRTDVLVIIPKEPVPYLDTALELVALHRLETTATELRDDPVGQRELHERTSMCEAYLKSLLAQVTEPVHGAARWYTLRGACHDVSSTADAQRLVSKLCDKTYPLTPSIRNEMINRSELTSNIALARTRLVAKLLEDNGQPNLGLTGNPAEMTIFRAVYLNHGVYRERVGGSWAISEPSTSDEGYRAVWGEIDRQVLEAKTQPKAADSLLEAIRRPPYGVRLGVSPLLMLGVMLCRRESIALYEDGVFVRDWSPDVFDRLLKRPDRFTLRYLALEGVRRWVVDEIRRRIPIVSKFVTGPDELSKDRFGETLKAIYRWLHSLPQYSRTTLSVSETAQKVRAALLTAKVPEKLLFEDLPAIFGIQVDTLSAPLQGKRADPPDEARHLVEQLTSALSEVDRAYADLLERIRTTIFSRVELPKDVSAARAQLSVLKQELGPVLSDSKAKILLLRASDERQNVREWTESIAAGMEGKPPAFWVDAQEEDFKNAVIRVAQQIKDARSLTEALTRTGARTEWDRFERVLIDSVAGAAYEEVVSRDELPKAAKRAFVRVKQALDEDDSIPANERRRVLIHLLKAMGSENR